MAQTADERRASKAASMRWLRARRRSEKRGADLFTPAPIVVRRSNGGDPALAVARWCETKLRVPFGPLMGQPFMLEPFQVSWLCEALKPGIREAGLCPSRARTASLGSWARLCSRTSTRTGRCTVRRGGAWW